MKTPHRKQPGTLDPAPSLVLEGTFVVKPEDDGIMLDRFVRSALGGPPWSKVRALIEQGHVLVSGALERAPTFTVRGGATVQVGKNRLRPTATPLNHATERTLPGDYLILREDSQVIVVDKPAGISTEPYDEDEKDTLLSRLTRRFRSKVHVVHRLDKETTGVLVFARTLEARDHLKNQFRFHTTDRSYLALVHDEPRSQTIRSRLVRDRGNGLRGSTENPTLGRDAVTRVDLVEGLGSASLVRCRLETGRTHQIRIHLSEAGHPLLGERVYSRSFNGDLLPAPRVMLHAQTLGFQHPVTLERLEFTREAPPDFAERLDTLRRDLERTLKRGTVERAERNPVVGPRR